VNVPTISVFYGIIVRMYFDEHPPPTSMSIAEATMQSCESTRWRLWMALFRGAPGPGSGVGDGAPGRVEPELGIGRTASTFAGDRAA